jgi:exopolysaccharide biosynthesis polyprenyl glycosylphosphotransferase
MINPVSTTLDQQAGHPSLTGRAHWVSRRRMTRAQRVIKRAIDVTASLCALCIVLPVLLCIAIAIRLESPGPVLFRQRRVGEGGRLFEIYKFRSMVAQADEQAAAALNALKRPGDSRVTRVGAFLRRTSLDELPQLFNILSGDMSLVGPRPEVPWRVERYESWQRARFLVPQGLTGWWQVTGRAEKPCHLSTEDDLFYVENYSLWLDLKIIMMTIPVVLTGRGAF